MSGELSSEILDCLVVCGAKLIRSYPDTKKSLEFTISLSGKYEHFTSKEAKVAFLWLLGLWCGKITESGNILEYFRNKFDTLSSDVQLQLLNSGVKMYIREIEPVESILSELLQSIAEKSDYPDLRDRAFFYWRILSETDSKLPEELVFTEYPAIKYEESIKPSEAYYIKQLPNLGR